MVLTDLISRQGQDDGSPVCSDCSSVQTLFQCTQTGENPSAEPGHNIKGPRMSPKTSYLCCHMLLGFEIVFVHMAFDSSCSPLGHEEGEQSTFFKEGASLQSCEGSLLLLPLSPCLFVMCNDTCLPFVRFYFPFLLIGI